MLSFQPGSLSEESPTITFHGKQMIKLKSSLENETKLKSKVIFFFFNLKDTALGQAIYRIELRPT